MTSNPDSADAAFPVVTIAGSTLHSCTAMEAIGFIVSSSLEGRGGWVLTPNLDILRRLKRSPEFAQLCSGTTLRLADGMPVIVASRLQRTPLPERVAGSDLIWSLSSAAAEARIPIFLLGGNPGTADAAAAVLKTRYPRLHVAGTYCPPIGFEASDTEMSRILDALGRTQPAIVFIALGSPKQEKLIQVLREAFSNIWYLGVGISFSFVAGEIPRAPRWMQVLGMEWLQRLSVEPRRLARRYLIHGLPFAVWLLVTSAVRGLAGPGAPPRRD